jgi:predicted AAA+ superfamily ATPase
MTMREAAFYPRWIAPRVREAMQDTPVVLLAGPRQVGKTTLVRTMAAELGLSYLTLDDAATLLAARQDPVGLVRTLERAVIDEVQRVPSLLLAIKQRVDEDRRPGRFLLTGSANLMAMPTVADSLAGRMETLTLWPLAQGEIERRSDNWIDHALEGRVLQPVHPVWGSALVERVLRGGYPEVVARDSPRRRVAWARQYVQALLQRDVREVASIDKLDHMPRLLRALAQMAGQLCNHARLGAEVGLDGKTAARYLGVFEQLFLLRRLEAWSRNGLSRIIKTPKLHFVDAGLLAALLDLTPERVGLDRLSFGHVLETFVYAELLKLAAVARTDIRLSHYRDADQVEVDLVIEDAVGHIVGVEVKAAATVTARDLRGLAKLRALGGDRFRLGVLLYDGTMVLPMGPGLWAAPISSLWGQAASDGSDLP